MKRTLSCLALSLALVATGPVAAATIPAANAAQHEVYGVVRRVDGERFVMQRRDGRPMSVDASAAWRAHQSVVPVVGNAVLVRGTVMRNGTLNAQTVLRAKDSPALWLDDR